MLKRNGLILLVACAALAAAGRAVADDGLGAPGASSTSARLAASGITLTEKTLLAEALSAEREPVSARPRAEPRNPMLALLMSCAVPGWGEFYTGHPARGRAFMTAEAAIWASWGGFKVQAGMREDDWREHAEVFAGVPDGASNAYYQDVADYIRSEGYDSYNEAVRDDARSLYPDDPAGQDAYLAENGYFGDDAWEWESGDRFREYRRLRQLAGESDRRAFYMTGLAVLNRAVSAIDSAWMARRSREGAATGSHPSLSVVPDVADGRVGARTTLTIPF
jgi:hypothetical protein